MSSTSSPEPTEPDEIRRDIEQTREQLAETVDALTARLDIKSRAKGRVQEVRDTAAVRVQEATEQAAGTVNDARSWAQQTWSERPQAVVAAASAALGALVVLLVARRRR